MPILKRKCKEFPNKTPIFFELPINQGLNDFKFDNSGRKNYRSLIADKLNLTSTENNLRHGYSHGCHRTSFGIVLANGIIAIALRDNISDKLEIYCRESYFNDNESHKKYVNKFAKDNGLSVRKDIYYVESDLIDSWIRPFEVGLEFYDEEVQANNSKAFLEKLKVDYPIENLIEVPSELVN